MENLNLIYGCNNSVDTIRARQQFIVTHVRFKNESAGSQRCLARDKRDMTSLLLAQRHKQVAAARRGSFGGSWRVCISPVNLQQHCGAESAPEFQV